MLGLNESTKWNDNGFIFCQDIIKEKLISPPTWKALKLMTGYSHLYFVYIDSKWISILNGSTFAQHKSFQLGSSFFQSWNQNTCSGQQIDEHFTWKWEIGQWGEFIR